MMRAVIGARVSKDEQAEEGYGLPTQIEKSLEYITHRGYTLVTSAGFANDGIDYIPGVFQEDYTGKVMLRPAIRSLLDAIEPHRIQVVIFHRTNRLGRLGSVQKVLEAEFRARGVKVEYVTAQFDTSNHYGRFMRNIFGDVDELDYENIIYQLKTGKEQAVKQGSVMVARPPYGYNLVKVRREDGKLIQVLEINEDEAHIVRLIFIWYAYGDETAAPLTTTGIVNKLTAMHIPTRWDTAYSRKGEVGLKRRTQPACVWTPSIVSRMLQSETYIGRWAYRKSKRVPVPNSDATKPVPAPREDWLWVDVPPIVDEELFQAAQERLKYNARIAKRHGKYTYLFSGMFTCEACKRSYCGDYAKVTAQYYRCTGTRTYKSVRCHMPNFREDELDVVIWPWIQEIVSHPDKIEASLQERQRDAEEKNVHISSLIASADKLIGELKAEQDKILTLFKKGKLDEERWEAEDKQCQKQIVEAELQRRELEAKLTKLTYSPEYLSDVRAACGRIAAVIEHFTHEEKREVYELLNLTATLAVEDGLKVAHVECILDTRRLVIRRRNRPVQGVEG